MLDSKPDQPGNVTLLDFIKAGGNLEPGMVFLDSDSDFYIYAGQQRLDEAESSDDPLIYFWDSKHQRNSIFLRDCDAIFMATFTERTHAVAFFVHDWLDRFGTVFPSNDHRYDSQQFLFVVLKHLIQDCLVDAAITQSAHEEQERLDHENDLWTEQQQRSPR